MSTLAFTILTCVLSCGITTTPTAPPSETYFVWTGGGCSRSLEEVARYKSAEEACSKAEELRSSVASVFILEGNSDWGVARNVWLFTEGKTERPEGVAKCSLFRFVCRGGWAQDSSISEENPTAAQSLAKSLQEQNAKAFVVYHVALE